MKIRQAKHDDLDDLVALERKVFGRGPYRGHQFGTRQFAYYVKKPEAIVLVAVDGKRLVGNVIATAGTGSRSHIGRILNLAVLPSARGRGMGTRLLRTALVRLKRRGCAKAVLEVAYAAKAARQVFERCGFEPARRLPGHYGPGNHGLRMTRNL